MKSEIKTEMLNCRHSKVKWPSEGKSIKDRLIFQTDNDFMHCIGFFTT
jgi:hypothetical protein